MILKSSTNNSHSEGPIEPSGHSEQGWSGSAAGQVRAYAYVRRRLSNILALVLGNAVAWWVTWLGCTWLGRTFDWKVPPAEVWLAFFVLHQVALYAMRVLPGWGRGIVNELRQNVNALMLAFAVGLLADLVQHDHYFHFARMACFALIMLLPLVLGLRGLVKSWLLSRGQWGIPTVIYGVGETGRQVIRALLSEPGLGYIPVAAFDDDPQKGQTDVEGLPVLGATSEVMLAAPVAIVALSTGTEQTALLDGPLSVYRTVIVVPNLFDVQTLWARTTDLGGVLGIRLNHTLADPWQRRLKRAFDLLAVGLSAPVWVPVCLLLALLIWLEDREKPLFLQSRVGLGGQMFETWKFRTMVPHAETVLQARLASDPVLRAEWEQNFKLRHDPRITRIGNLLRKTSLDELPQLVNVWRGDMSLVGPRPLPLYHQTELPQTVQQLRNKVRPGMTGLWQVSGRSDAGNEGMIRLDPYYVRNWSGWLDLVILARTFKAVLRSAGAY